MMYYQVVLSGDHIYFENANTAQDPADPQAIIGFISCRLIQAASEDLAIAIAKRDLLVHWNHSFNADRKLGMPQLHVEHIAQLSRWRKPKISNDYYWFTDLEHKQQQLDKLIHPPKRWFWQRADNQEVGLGGE